MWKDRLRREFDLAMVVMFCVITALGITPFAVYRFTQGQTLLGVIDLLIVACISLGALHALRTGRTEGAALVVAMTYSIGCIAVATLDGFAGLVWVFPVLVANSLLVRGWRAMAISAVVIVAVGIVDTALTTVGEETTYAVTTLVVSLFASVFALRSELQRRQLETIASNDPLTGANNRRGMLTELEIAMAASTRTGTPLGLLVFDLDHFKQINDSFGHEAGDQVLIQIAHLVHRYTRKNDRFFRVGGEEFALLIPGANATSLREIAEKLRRAVEGELRCHGRAITISVGATRYCPGESAMAWQGRADAAMYRAKRNGRDCSVIDETCDDAVTPPTHRPSSPRRPVPSKRRHAA